MQRHRAINTTATWGAFTEAWRRQRSHIHTQTSTSVCTHVYGTMWDKQWIDCKLQKDAGRWRSKGTVSLRLNVAWPHRSGPRQLVCSMNFWDFVVVVVFVFLVSFLISSFALWASVLFLFFCIKSLWCCCWPGVEARLEFLSDRISQPPNTQRPAKAQALTFTTNGPPSTETSEWHSHLSPWRAGGQWEACWGGRIKSERELNWTAVFFCCCLPPLTMQTDTHTRLMLSCTHRHTLWGKFKWRRRRRCTGCW